MDNDIKKLPKAELHVHIEGTVTPDMARKKAAQHGMTLPSDIFTSDGAAYQWKDFLDCVTRVYDAVASAIRTKQDFSDITYDYLMRCAAENVIYVELIASPDHGVRLGLSYKDMIDGIAAGIDKARTETGIEARINATLVRHLSDEDLQRAVDNIIGYRHPYVTGLDLAGGESEGDVLKFKKYFDEIKKKTNGELGMRLHAGEAAGPQNMKDALVLNPKRIGHGVRVIEDPVVMQDIIDRDIVLEVCPTSNVLAGIYKSYDDHPLRQLADAGVKLCLNSDDPGLFGKSIGDEYQIAKDRFGFTGAELFAITRQAIEVAFVDDKTRKGLMNSLTGEEKASGTY